MFRISDFIKNNDFGLLFSSRHVRKTYVSSSSQYTLVRLCAYSVVFLFLFITANFFQRFSHSFRKIIRVSDGLDRDQDRPS